MTEEKLAGRVMRAACPTCTARPGEHDDDCPVTLAEARGFERGKADGYKRGVMEATRAVMSASSLDRACDALAYLLVPDETLAAQPAAPDKTKEGGT